LASPGFAAPMVRIIQEFREFAVKGSVIDLAVGVIIGAAFGAIVKSLVEDLIMPLVGLVTGGIDFVNRYWVVKGEVPAATSLAEARALPGTVVVAYGQFLNNVFTFLIVAWVIFLFVKGINRMRRRQEKPADPTERPCPDCLTAIPKEARRCKSCGVQVTPV
jgi:large conductance mechanosensitive channel